LMQHGLTSTARALGTLGRARVCDSQVGLGNTR
jgi:hypothetical protein